MIGTGVTTLLLAVLAFTRLSELEVEETFIMLNDVEVVEMTPPPPPPDLSELEPEKEELQPLDLPLPTPSLDVPLDTLALDAPSVIASLTKIDIRTPLQSFHVNQDVAKIPVPKPVVKAAPKPTKVYAKTRSKVTASKSTPKPKPAPKPVAKEFYRGSELDSLPRARRTGRFSWPSRAKGRSGVVKLLIEISTKGKVRVVKVVSSTDSALTTAAQKIATGSLYTTPTYKGKAVKAQFYKTYNLKKP